MNKNLFLIFCIIFLFCENKKDFNNNQLNSNSVYLFFRGTDTKQGYISKEYNLFHKGLSHVGIGVNYDYEFLIYHIVNSDKPSHLEISPLNSFFDNSSKINYIGVWEIQNINKEKKTKLKNILNQYKNQEYKFDLSFIQKNDNKLYCSEFVVEVLRKLDSCRFKFKKSKIKLQGLHSAFLKRDTLEYFPTDVFIVNKNFKNIFEFYKK